MTDEDRKAILDEARETLRRTAAIGEPDYLAAALARPVTSQNDRDIAALEKRDKQWALAREQEADRKRRDAAKAASTVERTVASLAKATATMAGETAAEIDRLHKLVAKLTKRLDRLEQKPNDLSSVQSAVGRLDATCAQLQTTMQKYFEASHHRSVGEIIDLPSRRSN